MALWDKISSRGNVEDRRGMTPLAIGGGGLGLGGIALFLILTYLNGGNATDVLNQLPLQAPTAQISSEDFAGADNYEVFTSTVLGSTTDYWTKAFAAQNLTYTPPKLVLFRTATQSACGYASSEMGPHYCPEDQTIYLDETFFDELQTRFQAKGGDVAESYVIAHEVGHHAQNLLGTLDELQNPANARNRNQLSIQQELQADCYAGLWANSIRDLGVFEPNEIIEALDAASAVGDDRIQKAVEGRVDPENWTHGSSEQRQRAFEAGFGSGQLATCNI
jgi:uncharacterized protein